MATRVRITNFQSIEDAEIEIDGFTVISGSNSAGKTALMRAIKGVFENTGGNYFVRYGAKHCGVQIDFSDGNTVLWEKGSGVNRYTVNGHVLENVGQSVPQEVFDLGVGPIKAGGSDLWPQFAEQFGGQVFLLDKTGAVIAEAVSDVDRVGRLNNCLQGSESERISKNRKLKDRQESQTKLEEDLEIFEGLDDVSDDIDSLLLLESKAKKLSNGIVKATSLRDSLVEATNTVSNLSGISSISVPPSSDVSGLSDVVSDIQTATRLRDSYHSVVNDIEQCQGILEVEALDVDADFILVDKIYKAIEKITGYRDDLANQMSLVSDLQKQLRDSIQNLKTVEAEYRLTLSELPECPTCGSNLHDGDSHMVEA
jgi:hypothetical protein